MRGLNFRSNFCEQLRNAKFRNSRFQSVPREYLEDKRVDPKDRRAKVLVEESKMFFFQKGQFVKIKEVNRKSQPFLYFLSRSVLTRNYGTTQLLRIASKSAKRGKFQIEDFFFRTAFFADFSESKKQVTVGYEAIRDRSIIFVFFSEGGSKKISSLKNSRN